MLKPTKYWDDFKDKSGSSVVSLMNESEEIVKEFIIKYHISVPIYLTLAEKHVLGSSGNMSVAYPVTPNAKPKYTIFISTVLFERFATSPADFFTCLCHELGHIYYEDSKYFTSSNNINLNCYNAVLLGLKETRADIFGTKLMLELHRNPSFNWIKGDGSYKKNGYFDKTTRKELINYSRMYYRLKYNKEFVCQVFKDYYEKDKFMTYLEISQYYMHKRINPFKLFWIQNLLIF